MSTLQFASPKRFPIATTGGRPLKTLATHQTPSASKQLCDLIALTTSAAFAVPIDELLSTSRRTPYIAFARQSAMYVAHVRFGLSFSDVGCGFGRDRTTAAHACRLVEDRRDDPAVDMVLGSLESACDALSGRVQP